MGNTITEPTMPADITTSQPVGYNSTTLLWKKRPSIEIQTTLLVVMCGIPIPGDGHLWPEDNNNETGRGWKTCKYYSLLDSILGHRPATVPPCLLDTADSSQPFLESEEELDGTLTNQSANTPLWLFSSDRWIPGAGSLASGRCACVCRGWPWAQRTWGWWRR